MFDPKQFDEMARKFCASLPSSLQNFEQEIHQKFKAILESTFANLNLVTRDEFDVQIKVLARTRQKLEALEKKVKELLAKDNESNSHNEDKLADA